MLLNLNVLIFVLIYTVFWNSKFCPNKKSEDESAVFVELCVNSTPKSAVFVS